MEYGEEFADELQRKLIVYLNRESYTAGDFGAGGVHSLQPFINAITREVYMPGDSLTIYEAWKKKAKENRLVTYRGDTHVRIRALGSGSDYTVFLDHLGIPSINLGFSSGNGIYHSRYDSHWFFTTFGDPGFAHGKKLAELTGLFLLRMANCDIFPFDYYSTAETISGYIKELKKEAEKRGLKKQIDFHPLKQANQSMAAVARVLNDEIDRILQLDARTQQRNRKRINQLNRLLHKAEQDFLYAQGLPGRPWYRHQIYAPGFYTGYGVKTLPGIREAIEKEDAQEANQMLQVLIERLHSVRKTLLQAVLVAARITAT